MDSVPAILCAAEDGNLAEVAEILRADPGQVRVVKAPDEPKTALHYAAEQNHPEVAELLLRYGANVHAKGPYGLTPLHLAAESDAPDVIALLLKHGADLEAKANGGHTPLLWAATKGVKTRPAIECLVRHGANLQARNNQGLSVMQLAGIWWGIGVAEVLSEHGIQLEIHSAMLLGKADLVRSLLKSDPELVKKTPEAQYLLHKAVQLIEKSLWESGLMMSVKKQRLGKKLVTDHVDIFELLFAQGVPLTDSYNALFYAVQLPDSAVAEVLLKHGANVEDERSAPGGLLMAAGYNTHCRDEMLALLRNHGAQPAKVDPTKPIPAVVELTAVLKDKDPTARFMAATSLGLYGPRAVGAVPMLQKALQDPDASVRSAAAEALKQIGAPQRGAK